LSHELSPDMHLGMNLFDHGRNLADEKLFNQGDSVKVVKSKKINLPKMHLTSPVERYIPKL